MPYLHMALTKGYSAEQKRSLIREMTDCTVEAMEVPPSEVHIFLWEFDTENLGSRTWDMVGTSRTRPK